ncbi:hypothetical protein BDZ89DRAFT_1081000 [Hymenopellis radicata]|nr:hypothetical protein BDZ89DRAFT_1081000 [Hymenopellis radicata]
MRSLPQMFVQRTFVYFEWDTPLAFLVKISTRVPSLVSTTMRNWRMGMTHISSAVSPLRRYLHLRRQ